MNHALPPSGDDAKVRMGWWLGALAILMFAATIPATRMAAGTSEAPALSGVFVASARAVIAALLSIAWLCVMRLALPQGRQWGGLALTALGVVLGFPLCMSVAMRHLPAMQASVVLGFMPISTAIMSSYWLRQKLHWGFWLCSALGSGLTLWFIALQQPAGFGAFAHGADSASAWAYGLLLLATLCGAMGYTSGAALSRQMQAETVICWALVLSLPITTPLSVLSAPAHAIAPSAWASLMYLAVFSMWISFFLWYRALAWGGAAQVSQLQLLQPLAAMLIAVPWLGESLSPTALLFGLAIAATVWAAKRFGAAPLPQAQRPTP